MTSPAPYAEIPSVALTDLPGELPGDVISADVNLEQFAQLSKDFLTNFSEDKLIEGALWRDFFAVTGRLRTFHSSKNINREWGSRSITNLETEPASISRFTQNSSWIDVIFKFSIAQESGLLGDCFGILSFVPSDGEHGVWKVWMLQTMLEAFSGHGHPDDPTPIFKSPSQSPSESESSEHKYEVVVLGGGQSGLSISGRLGALGIKYLLLEKEAEIGRSWTGKYDAVRQHTIREMNNLPFDRTYAESDPMLLPAKTVARGFQEYVKKYKINVWCAAETRMAVKSEDGGWNLSVMVRGKEVKVETKHLVFAMGACVSVPNIPEIPRRESFKGEVLHQTEFKNAKAWKGRRGIVVGTGTTAHDVAQDMLDNGLESITMIQRGKTPVWPVEWISQALSIYNTPAPPPLIDRLISLVPLTIERQLTKANLLPVVNAHSDYYDSIEKSGFRVDREAVLTDRLLIRGGGYYIDVGTSKHIADGEIKIKSGIKIESFTKAGLKFADGEELQADVVVLATGYQKDPRRQVAKITGDEIAGNMPWGIGIKGNGERRGDMRPSGEGLWIMRGAVNFARFFSRFVALQIQAELMGKPLPDYEWSD